ncbi:MAG: hypothetical protein JWM34_4818 [Ilumatobacteraceae bacterium]|nr:hypothetical protein [Ilumatobacteraceae bacterium]
MNDTDADFARDILARLAATMPDNPGRVRQVQRLTRRRRNRRVATRATVGLGLAAGVGFVAVAGAARRPQPVATADAPADMRSTSDTASLPASTMPIDVSGPCADIGSSQPPAAADSSARIKVAGTITAADDASVTVSGDPGLTGPASITAVFAATTTYRDGGRPTTSRPTLAVGEHVALAAVLQPDGSYVLDELAVNQPDSDRADPSDPDGSVAATKQAEAHAAANAEPDLASSGVKVSGTVTAVDGSSITVTVEEATIEVASVTAAFDASSVVDGAPSTGLPTLAVGDHVAFTAAPAADGHYVIGELSTAADDTSLVTTTETIDKLQQAKIDCATSSTH